MPPIRIHLPIHSLVARSSLFHQSARRAEATYQPPTPPSSGSDRHRNFYKTFGRPLAKNFLIAVATYQVLYFTWLKLESYETKEEGEGEVRRVEGELRGLVEGRRGREG